MGKNIVEKILAGHLAAGEMIKGSEIGIRIDQTLTQDATGTMAYLQFESMGIPRVKTDLSVSYVDHNTVQKGFENADDHLYLQTVAKKYGIRYSRAGNGICHQVHLERFGKPGGTLLGSDSHTPTGGGIGMIAIGAGGLDVAVAMGGGPFYITCPEVTRINLHGKLNPWVAAKDVILKVLEILTTRGNVGTMVEYGGDGVAALSVPERATITNMGAELGVTSSVFPSDGITREFLAAQDREADWTEVAPDKDAGYGKVIDIDLGELVPMVAQPHSPDNVATMESLAGKKIDQVMIGSCTNSSYRDNKLLGMVLKGRKVDQGTSVGLAPGSKQVLEMISRDGALADIVSGGVRILESACGFCIGNGQAPKTDAVSVRTNNRNFFGRSGTKSAGIYLVSVETAIACALTGEMTDPRTLGIDYPEITQPERFLIDDSMVLEPASAEEARDPEVFRGPNIGDPPSNNPLPDSLSGKATLKVGDKITTDHIMPAGNRLKYRSNVPKYASFVFEPVDESFPSRSAKNRDDGIHNFIIASESYGQGSSREHAALCPMYLGVKAVIAKSLERIHTANLVNFGIVPFIFADPADYDRIEQDDNLEAPGVREKLAAGGKVVLVNKTKGVEIPVDYNLSERQRMIILAGGRLNYTKNKT